MVQHVALFILLLTLESCFFVTAMKTGMSRSITTTNPERDAGAVAATHPVAARVHGMPISTSILALLDGATSIFADEQDEETPSPVPQHESGRKLHQTPPSSNGSVKALKKRPKVDFQLATMAPKDVEPPTMTTKQEVGPRVVELEGEHEGPLMRQTLARGDGRNLTPIAHHPHSPGGSPGGNKGKGLDPLEDSGSACSDGPSTRAHLNANQPTGAAGTKRKQPARHMPVQPDRPRSGERICFCLRCCQILLGVSGVKMNKDFWC
eukprot:g13390.t1